MLDHGTVEPSLAVCGSNGIPLLTLRPDGSYELAAPIDEMVRSHNGLVRAFGRALKDAQEGKLQ